MSRHGRKTLDRAVSGDSAGSALDESPYHQDQAKQEQDVNGSGGDLEPEPEKGPEHNQCDAQPDECLHNDSVILECAERGPGSAGQVTIEPHRAAVVSSYIRSHLSRTPEPLIKTVEPYDD